MSSQYAQPGEIQKPTPRRLFSHTNDTSLINSSDSQIQLVNSPVQDARQKDPRQISPLSNPGYSSPVLANNNSGPGAQSRWESIRHHVLMAGGRTGLESSRSGTPSPSTPFPPPPSASYHSYQPSSASSSSTTFIPRPPSRSQTPKLPGSRLAARLGFKQVVDHARETAVDENRKLEEDIFRACWAARSYDVFSSGGGRIKHGDINSVTGASSKHLPFTKGTLSSVATGASLSSDKAGPSGSGNFHSKKSDQWQSSVDESQSPYTSQSSTSTFNVSAPIASASVSAYNVFSPTASNLMLHNAPSVKYLHQTLWQASGPSTVSLRSVHLPHESLVLSALLEPFLSTDINGGPDEAMAGRLVEERWLAVDAFELVAKTWPPANELASAERCLWCTKACTPLAPSPLRSRLLSSLWSITNPNENTHVFLSPDTIQTVACAAFILFRVISLRSLFPVSQNHTYLQGQQADENSSDCTILKEVLSHLSIGALDEEACEDEYSQMRWNSREDDAGIIRQMMISEALARCIQLNVGYEWETRGWLVKYFFKEYWTRLGHRPTPLQGSVAVRRIVHLCNGFLSILSLPPPTPASASAASQSIVYSAQPDGRSALVQHILQLTENIIIPEARIISSLFANAENKAKGMEVRMSITRLIFELLCFAPGDDVVIAMGSANVNPTRWAVGLITSWYNQEEEQAWKVSFEETLERFVTHSDWQLMVDKITRLVTRLGTTPDVVGIRKDIIAVIFPHLTDRLIQDPPLPSLLGTSTSASRTRAVSSQSIHSRSSSYTVPSTSYSTSSSASLTTLLLTLSYILPQTFFKPIFALATSSSDVGTVGLAHTLCLVSALSGIVKDWWVRDAEMICIACMSDIGGQDTKGKGKARDDGSGDIRVGRGSRRRLGQMIILLEVTEKLRMLRRLRDSSVGGAGSAGAITAALGGDAARLNLSKFVTGLELRLSVLVETMEAQAPLSLTQRLLLVTLFRELRLLTRSIKPAPWLPVVLRWFEDYCTDEEGVEIEEMLDVVKEIKEVYELAKGTVGNLNKRRTVVMLPTNVYDKDAVNLEGETLNLPGKLDSTLKFLSSFANGFLPRAIKLLVTVSAMLTPGDWDQIAPLVWRNSLLHSGITDDTQHSNDNEGKKARSLLPLVCFLVMQCAEKNPSKFRVMVEFDLKSSDDLTRLESVQKLSLLVNWRFQVMSESHNILVDRTHRPFKLARAPLPFVPADMGSPTYVHNDGGSSTFSSVSGTHHHTNTGHTRRSKGNDMKKDAIPVELKRQLVEIGWVDDDTRADEQEMWIWTPVSMLPVNQVEKLDSLRFNHSQHQYRANPSGRSTSPTLSSSTSTGGQLNPLTTSSASGKSEEELLRRNSSSGGPTYAKRRAVFVPPLSLVFRVLACMVFDSNFTVASAARDTLLDLMRNDPGLLLRPILDLLCEDQGQGHDDSSQKDIPQAVNILNALIHTRHMIPPPMAHATFNNLAGFLKYILRQVDPLLLSSKSRGNIENPGAALTSFALVAPIMAKLGTYVGDLTIREIRRSKMEHFLIPYGTLWFNYTGVPAGPMFPRGLGLDIAFKWRGGQQKTTNPFQSPSQTNIQMDTAELDPKLVSVIMIRIAQNTMFVDMLKKAAQDVTLVRKTMPRFVLPKLNGGEAERGDKKLELKDFVPSKEPKARTERIGYAQKTLNVLSLALARSYVILVAQVFRCMSRNSNDREEVENFVDGLNRILLFHGDDIGIIGHVLIAFMVASARFRRLFTSGGGYTLFMPVLVKIYADSHERVDVKLAIEYAVYRFYALHREAFLFQALDTIAWVAALPSTDTMQYAARVYDLFYSLRSGIIPTALDPAGIHNMNRSQEREALLFHAVEDKPQTFLTAIRRGDGPTSGQVFFELNESYESSRLRIEDLVKLFLTIIAHDPANLRAQNFMHLFRFLAPHLYDASPQARGALQQGMAVLSEILLKPFTKSKNTDIANTGRTGEPQETMPNPASGAEAFDKNKNASASSAMRLDFLYMLTAVVQTGCPLTPQMLKQAVELFKLVLKDSPPDMFALLSRYFAELTSIVSLRGDSSNPKIVVWFLQEITPVIRAYSTILDFTPLLEAVTQMSSTTPHHHDNLFARLVVHDVCVSGLDASDQTNLPNPRFHPLLVSLVAEAVFLRGADVIGELEKRRPSFSFLLKMVLPLTLTLKTSHQLASESGKSEEWHRMALTRAWIRILFYAMTACQRSFRAAQNLPLSRSKSRDKKIGEEMEWQAHLPTFATALQIIKVIVIRAENEISSTFPDLWSRLAGFLKSALTDGNANFALHTGSSKKISPLPSPSPSPRGSYQVDRSGQFPSLFDLSGQSTMDTSMSIMAQPRVIDYALWSVLEFLCAYRSPLRLQLRLFTVEKVVALDQELKHRQRHTSPFASPNPSPMNRRISSSIFAKPRRSGIFPSPDSSPRASRSPSMIHELSIPSIHLGPGMGRTASLEIPTSSSGELRIPGYQYSSPTLSPSTPKQSGTPYIQIDGHGHRIIHLGPTSPSALIPPSPLSPSGGGSMGVSNIHLMAQSTKIKSSVLIKATYRRIRTVQTLMGYDTLLPIPAMNVGLGITELETEPDEISFVTWTKRAALDAVLKEMKQLEEEFEESLQSAGIAVEGEMDASALTETGTVLPPNLTRLAQ